MVVVFQILPPDLEVEGRHQAQVAVGSVVLVVEMVALLVEMAVPAVGMAELGAEGLGVGRAKPVVGMVQVVGAVGTVYLRGMEEEVGASSRSIRTALLQPVRRLLHRSTQSQACRICTGYQHSFLLLRSPLSAMQVLSCRPGSCVNIGAHVCFQLNGNQNWLEQKHRHLDSLLPHQLADASQQQ